MREGTPVCLVCRIRQQGGHLFACCDPCGVELRSIKPFANRIEGLDLDALCEPGLVVDQSRQFGPKSIGQRVGKCGQENPGIGVGAGKPCGSVNRHDGLAGPGRTEHPGRTGEIPFYDLSLHRMEKNRPLLPRIAECAFQLRYVVHDTETTLGIGVLKGVRGHACPVLGRRFRNYMTVGVFEWRLRV